MRGEKPGFRLYRKREKGSPPRARGKGTLSAWAPIRPGITPACAGKRYRASSPGRGGEDHPRVRGEKYGKRGRLKIYQDHPRVRGEKSFFRVEVSQLWGSPPRARGKASISRISHSLLGSPPRARGKEPMRLDKLRGITPACAGKSLTMYLQQLR